MLCLACWGMILSVELRWVVQRQGSSAASGQGVVLSGWAAILGVVAVVLVLLGGFGLAYQQYTGINPLNYLQGYTILVAKTEKSPVRAAPTRPARARPTTDSI